MPRMEDYSARVGPDGSNIMQDCTCFAKRSMCRGICKLQKTICTATQGDRGPRKGLALKLSQTSCRVNNTLDPGSLYQSPKLLDLNFLHPNLLQGRLHDNSVPGCAWSQLATPIVQSNGPSKYILPMKGFGHLDRLRSYYAPRAAVLILIPYYHLK